MLAVRDLFRLNVTDGSAAEEVLDAKRLASESFVYCYLNTRIPLDIGGLAPDTDDDLLSIGDGDCPAVRSPDAFLVVLDLDFTLLNTPLSEISLRGEMMGNAEELFIDAAFLVELCEALHEKGHVLAIASRTDGAEDRHVLGLSAAASVLAVLDTVLPASRSYLDSTDCIVCHPSSKTAPGKQHHLETLQDRLNRHQLLPTWLSTDIVLIDDSEVNCAAADRRGYRAACCPSGLCRAWYRQQPHLHQLLGMSSL